MPGDAKMNMFRFKVIRDRYARRCGRQFVDRLHPGRTFGLTQIYRSRQYPRERWIYRLDLDEAQYALKMDVRADVTGRLRYEYATLKELDAYFKSNPQAKGGVVAPRYLSPDGKFLVNEFIDRPTAEHFIHHLESDRAAAQIFRRAGAWLDHLHSFEPREQTQFWPNWMFEEMAALIADGPQADEADYAPMIAQMRRDATRVTGLEDLAGFRHGDFHAGNLIISEGQCHGLDVKKIREKLLVYDIVDFLKADVLRPCAPESVDRSGISSENKAEFFQLYRHRVNRDILDYCLRGRLLIDWLEITPAIYSKRSCERTKFAYLKERLTRAFARPF